MRIISGTHKGRLIKPPTNFKARPTTDIAREGLFNILANRYDFEDLTIADLFGGTGAISYEFASRGVKEIYCIELHALHYKFIKETAKSFGFDNIKIYRNDALNAIDKLPKKHFDLIFADPPFDMTGKENLISKILNSGILNDGTLIFEHGERENFQHLEGYYDVRKYGKVNFSFFKEINK